VTPRASIVLASNNRGKLAEFAKLLAPYDVEVLPLSRFAREGADETGTTFRDNALLKARHASRLARLPAIADDSGLEVDALDGAPGVYSARFAGPNASDEDNNRKLLAVLAAENLRTARFRCALAYVRDADAEPIVAEGVWEGSVLNEPRGTRGFGYDPLFLAAGGSLTAAELGADEKNRASHRGQAMQALLRQLLASGELRAKA
jgi:XTP/dITP diphosphohydrolase